MSMTTSTKTGRGAVSLEPNVEGISGYGISNLLVCPEQDMISSWLFRVLLLLSCLLLVRTVVSVPESHSLREPKGRSNVLNRADRARLKKEEMRREGMDEVSHTTHGRSGRYAPLPTPPKGSAAQTRRLPRPSPLSGCETRRVRLSRRSHHVYRHGQLQQNSSTLSLLPYARLYTPDRP